MSPKLFVTCLCIENFEYTFSAKIETLVFPMHEDHIIFALTGEKGVEMSTCFEARTRYDVMGSS